MTAVGLALLAAVAFGGLSLLVRHGLQRTGDVIAGTIVQSVVALTLLGLVAVGRSELGGDLAPFLLTGLLVPGLAQVLFVSAIRDAGPSRVSVLVNTSPLLSVPIALIALGEPFRAELVAGAVLVVAGGVFLAAERGRPDHVRVLGLVLAVAVAVCFAVRDNLVRHFALDTEVGPELAAAAMLASGSVPTSLLLAAQRRRGAPLRRLRKALLPFAPAGLALGTAYLASYEAFFHGRVVVVAPLIGTASLWAVLFSVLLLRRVELVGRHVLLGAVLVVGGAALIGALR